MHNNIDFIPRELSIVCSRPRARRLVLCDIQLCLTWLWWVSRIEKKSWIVWGAHKDHVTKELSSNKLSPSKISNREI